MKKAINKMSRFCYQPSLGLLLIRLAIGLVFFMHGWTKIHNVTMVTGMMVHLGVVAPTFFGAFISWFEVVGAVALILGVLTRVFAVALGIEMLCAIFLTGIGSGYQSHEFEIVLMLVSFGIALAGSGRYSVYRMECRKCGGMLCGGIECTKVGM